MIRYSSCVFATLLQERAIVVECQSGIRLESDCALVMRGGVRKFAEALQCDGKIRMHSGDPVVESQDALVKRHSFFKATVVMQLRGSFE